MKESMEIIGIDRIRNKNTGKISYLLHLEYYVQPYVNTCSFKDAEDYIDGLHNYIRKKLSKSREHAEPKELQHMHVKVSDSLLRRKKYKVGNSVFVSISTGDIDSRETMTIDFTD